MNVLAGDRSEVWGARSVRDRIDGKIGFIVSRKKFFESCKAGLDRFVGGSLPSPRRLVVALRSVDLLEVSIRHRWIVFRPQEASYSPDNLYMASLRCLYAVSG